MILPSKIFGRLGNQMFQYAALYTFARELNTDFYFQDTKYFEKYEKEIRQLFSEGIGFLQQVSIHVRRGDYVGNPFHINLSETDYYDRAIEMFPHDNFLVFSDDIEWCKKKWGDNPRFQIMEGDEIEDFNLMASCKHNIISNSTYSWWAAFLNPNNVKKVICPKQWFHDGKERISIPKEWLKI